jgi:hypothetical protein
MLFLLLAQILNGYVLLPISMPEHLLGVNVRGGSTELHYLGSDDLGYGIL